MENKIISYLYKYNRIYVKINDPSSFKIIYDLLIDNIISNQEEFPDPIIYHYYGVYYEINGQISKMEKYYLKAIEHGIVDSMLNMGFYHQRIGNSGQMEKYYLMAIGKGNVNSMYFMGIYYEELKYYDEMKIYYLMAIDKGDIESIYRMAYYYRRQGKIEKMFKYYLLAIENYQDRALHELRLYFEDEGHGMINQIKDNQIKEKLNQYINGNYL